MSIPRISEPLSCSLPLSHFKGTCCRPYFILNNFLRPFSYIFHDVAEDSICIAFTVHATKLAI